MKRFSWLISKYLLQAITPYFIFTWLLISVILFVQQASRYSDIFFSANIPANIVWQLTFALAPNVIAFTCPMAILIGVVIGLSRMQGDSELTAIRAVGIGNIQITLPIVILSLLLSLFAFFINLKGVPFAAQIIRKIAIQAAIYKLESPIEPGVFNTEINGYTIYVKGGDIETGAWKNIFIYNEDVSNNVMRLITSKSGRVDFNEESNELVLEDALITTLPLQNIDESKASISNEFSNKSEKESYKEKYVSENVGQVRFAIQTKRGELIDKLSKSEQSADELGLSELYRYIQGREGKEKVEAQILWQRRIMLSITPLLFAVLGTGLILRTGRASRGFGIFLALIVLVGYYLIALLGEQLARTGQLNVFIGGLLPIVMSIGLIIWLFTRRRFFFKTPFSLVSLGKPNLFSKETRKITKRKFSIGLTAGILDFDIILSLIKYLFLTLGFLSSIYIIFTAFELWKFAGTIDNGLFLLLKYLLFLIPFIYIQLVPSALMIATLATYVIKSRQNEIVTWTAAGQSVYRLLVPCFLFMICMGVFNWQLQEKILPMSNRSQDELRTLIRNRGVAANKAGKFWIAEENRIYSFSFDENVYSAERKVKNLTVYDFSENASRLQAIFRIQEAVWNKNVIQFEGEGEKVNLGNGKIFRETLRGGEIAESANPLAELSKKPGHLNAAETLEQMQNIESETERRNFEIALEKKRSTPFLPFIITLFTAPFALSLSRKGKAVTVGYAVGVWLLFMGTNSVFEQLGANGFILPLYAVWSPLAAFALLGVYMLSKIKT
ncbi:MAG TPA: LptF/LptG family permease [Pyrinomonadaceae bacterium]|jgi:lipopolysaccharide export LptBFGC system permease protein LptF